MRGGLRMLRWQNSVLIFDEAHNVEVRGHMHPAPLNNGVAGFLCCLSRADDLPCNFLT